jgi:hypothetical protein
MSTSRCRSGSQTAAEVKVVLERLQRIDGELHDRYRGVGKDVGEH